MKTDSNNYLTQAEDAAASMEKSAGAEDKSVFHPINILFSLAGIGLFVWAIFNERFWTSDQAFLNAGFCLPLAIAVGLIWLGFLIRTRWQNFAFWTALALIGQAAALQMINAGRLIHFQHYRPWPELLNGHFIAVLLFAGQFVLVAFAISKRLPAIKEWLAKNFSLWQLVLIALLMFFAGAAVTREVPIYLTSLVIAFLVQLTSLANIVLAVRAVPDDLLGRLKEKFENIFGESAQKAKPQIDKFAMVAALWVVAVAGMLSYFVYEAHPHVPDETQYLFQAKNMAAGQLTAKAPIVPEAFKMYMVPYKDANWYGIFSPAYPAVLAAGLKFGAGWLVNPLLAGACILLAYLFFQEIYSRRFARIGVLLLGCSPWFIFMAMSFMSHIFTLTCALTAAVLLLRTFRTEKILFAFGAGLAVGVVSLIRPLDGLIVAVLLGVWTLFKFENWTKRLLTSVSLVAGTVMTAALVLPYNKAVTGSATLLPMDAYYTKYFWKDVMALGFGANRGLDWDFDAFPGHSPLEAVINSALNTFSVNIDLFGWATGSIFLAGGFVLAGGLRKKDLWAIVAIVFTVGCFSLYWYSGGPDIGARYWFLCIIPLIALTVRGIEWFSQRTDEKSKLNPKVVLAVLILCGMSLLNYFPWRSLDKYYRYLEMQPGIVELAEKHDFGRSLVLIRGEEHPDYQSAWIYNPINFQGNAPIYAWDQNPEIRRKLVQNYADRPVWIVNGPTLANGKYEVLRGPVSANDILNEN